MCRRRWTPDGVTTTTETAVSPARGLTRSAMPTSLPPRSRARVANAWSASTADRPSAPDSAAWSAPPSTSVSVSSSPCASAPGLSAASASTNRSHGTSPSSVASWPADPISTIESVHPSPSSRSPIAPDQVVVVRSPRRARRSGSRTVRGSPLDERLGDSSRPRRSRRSGHRPRRARAYVATIGLAARSSVSPSRSASCDSPIPVSRYVRTATSAPSPRRRAGAGPRRPTSGASRGAVRAARRPPVHRVAGTNQPGAVPFGLGSASADGISQACLRLISGKGRSRRRQSSRSHASSSASTSGVSPRAAAIASRVRSSGVGPRPPVETTRSARWRPDPERLGHDVQAVGQGRQPADPTRRARSGRVPARRSSCRASRRRSARVPMLRSSAVRRGRPDVWFAIGGA